MTDNGWIEFAKVHAAHQRVNSGGCESPVQFGRYVARANSTTFTDVRMFFFSSATNGAVLSAVALRAAAILLSSSVATPPLMTATCGL